MIGRTIRCQPLGCQIAQCRVAKKNDFACIDASGRSRPMTSFRQFRQFTGVTLPMIAVELSYMNALDAAAVEAANVDTETVGIRSRNIERLDAANFTKKMLGNSGVECVSRQTIRTLQQLETGRRHNQMDEPGSAADRAVTFQRIDFGGRHDFESHSAAVTTAAVSNPWVRGAQAQSAASICLV